MKEIQPFILLFFFMLSWFLGFRLLKTKGYTSRWYFLTVFAVLPVFWLVFGLARSRVTTKSSKVWSFVAVLWGILSLSALVFHQWNDVEQLSATLTMVYVAVCGVLGYMFMKLKGYNSWNYVALIISFTPLFWLIFGLLRSNNERTTEKQLWSFVAVFWGFILLYITVSLNGGI